MQETNAQNMKMSWEGVLADAQAAFRRTRTHGNALKRSIAEIKKRIAAKEPFPLTGTNRASTQN